MENNSFWKSFFNLKKRYYIFNTSILFVLVYASILPSSLTDHFTQVVGGFGTFFVSLLYFIISSLVYPWVRLSLFNNPGSHYLKRALNVLKFFILAKPTIREIWTVYRPFNSSDVKINKHYEKSSTVITRLIFALFVIFISFFFYYFLEAFLLVSGPILFLIFNFSRAYDLAREGGFLSTGTDVFIETARPQIINFATIVGSAALIALICSLFTFGNLDFTLKHDKDYVNNTRNELVESMVTPYAKKYGLPKKLVDDSLTNKDTIDIIKKRYKLVLSGKDGKELADMFYDKVSHNLNDKITEGNNQKYLRAKKKFVTHYKGDLYHTKLKNKVTKEDIQQAKYQLRVITYYRNYLIIILLVSSVIIAIALSYYTKKKILRAPILDDMLVSALLSSCLLILLELTFQAFLKSQGAIFSEASNVTYHWFVAIAGIFFVMSLLTLMATRYKK